MLTSVPNGINPFLDVKELMEVTEWTDYITNDFRGTKYQHSYWSKDVSTEDCEVKVTYMLGYGENYVLFLPSDVIVFRFLDEYDLDFSDLVRSVEKIRSSCP